MLFSREAFEISLIITAKSIISCCFPSSPKNNSDVSGELSGSRLRAASLSDKRSAGSASSSGGLSTCGPLFRSNCPKQSSSGRSQLLLPTSKIPFSCEPALSDNSQLQPSKRHAAALKKAYCSCGDAGGASRSSHSSFTANIPCCSHSEGSTSPSSC